ncbi:hypothetical protein B0H10DRAFT_2204204 [Mycena sp. CBHHK59/15]|nr:hypothetical protein B0H10DRAFT_2204204 [Mycena sp. CBHHK59/15]
MNIPTTQEKSLTLELLVRQMDDLAELSDASRTGLRYLQRNNSTATRAQRPQSHALVSPNASPDVSRQSPNMNPDILSPRTLSVHSQREIPSILPASERMKDNFLSTTFQTTSMGRANVVSNVIVIHQGLLARGGRQAAQSTDQIREERRGRCNRNVGFEKVLTRCVWVIRKANRTGIPLRNDRVPVGPGMRSPSYAGESPGKTGKGEPGPKAGFEWESNASSAVESIGELSLNAEKKPKEELLMTDVERDGDGYMARGECKYGSLSGKEWKAAASAAAGGGNELN